MEKLMQSPRRHEGVTVTPFFDRVRELNQSALWMLWDGRLVADTPIDTALEVETIRSAVAVGDMSPLSKYEVRGPDSERFVNHLVTRDVTKLALDQVYYTPWCAESGQVVGDGLVIRVGESAFQFSGDPHLRWFTEQSAGFDVVIEDITESICILTVQGPLSPKTLLAVTGDDLAELPFSRRRSVRIAGAEVMVLRQGFTGEIGYELWIAAEDALRVWDAVWEAGKPDGIRYAGARALDTARIEAGLLIIGYDYASAGPDEQGAAVPRREAFQASPYELGLGYLVDLSKRDFIGRTALANASSEQQQSALLGFEIDWRTIVEATVGAGLLPQDMRRVQWAPMTVRDSDGIVGWATSAVWSPTTDRVIGFCRTSGIAKTEQEVAIDWPVGAEVVELTATTVALPFVERRRGNPNP